MTVSVGIAGVSGYSGGEVLRLALAHPEFELLWVGGHLSAGQRLGDVHPWLLDRPASGTDIAAIGIQSLDDSLDLSGLDLLFVSLPAGESSKFVASLGAARPKKIVDIGPDFRLDAKTFERWYGMPHPLRDELGDWEYGFTEAFRDRIASARYVANPGCYASAALIALYPLAAEQLISGCVYIDGKSGLSGAGRSAASHLQLCEAVENVTPYSVAGHRHQPEIEDVLRDVSPEVSIAFVPHLVPMARGLLITAYVPLGSAVSPEWLADLYSSTYASEPFVYVLESPPSTKAVRGSNKALVHATVQNLSSEEKCVCVITAAIDNLVKGAAGSAVQNANVMFGLNETTGLSSPGLWP